MSTTSITGSGTTAMQKSGSPQQDLLRHEIGTRFKAGKRSTSSTGLHRNSVKTPTGIELSGITGCSLKVVNPLYRTERRALNRSLNIALLKY